MDFLAQIDQLSAAWLRLAEERDFSAAKEAMLQAEKFAVQLGNSLSDGPPEVKGLLGSVGTAIALSLAAHELLRRTLKSENGGQALGQVEAHELVDAWGRMLQARCMADELVQRLKASKGQTNAEFLALEVALIEFTHETAENVLAALGRRLGWESVAPVLTLCRSLLLGHLNSGNLGKRQDFILNC